MEAFSAWLLHSWMGAPVWMWGLVLFIGGINEIVQRAKWTQAQSVLQGLALFLLGVPILGGALAAIPLVGWLLRKMSGPAAAAAPDPNVARALLPIALLATICGCAPGADGARQGVANANTTIGLGYRGLRTHAREEAKAVKALHAAGKLDEGTARIVKLKADSDAVFKALDATADLSAATEEAISVAEAAKEKNYDLILLPLTRGVADLAAALKAAGVKISGVQ